LLQDEHAPEAHKPLFERLIAEGLLEMIRQDQRARIDRLLAEVLGPEFVYETLLKTNGDEGPEELDERG
jgi:precorrin-2 dehydrogenase/sirohydrochlorin ferrochelatase